ncbi:MAG: DUF1887 family protein [Firmicutes bacterium]|nr:DUF1887 family protein [Bacillota bacterium]
MNVNFEFFDENPIENVITSLHHKIDKTVFFGYESVTSEQRRPVETFLQNVCGVKEVKFCAVSETDLDQIIERICQCVCRELDAGNQVFFDLTGGESLPLVAFGIVSREFQAPMHSYDIRKETLREYGYEGKPALSQVAAEQKIQMNLDQYISLFGGKVNHKMHKSFKKSWTEEDRNDVEAMWKLSREFKNKWLHYSALLRKFPPDDYLFVSASAEEMERALKSNRSLGRAGHFHQFLDRCEALGFITSVKYGAEGYQFYYKNTNIKNYFWDGGSILEMYGFLLESEQDPEPSDCRVGVHIDWDGVFHREWGVDVLNEIDIMSIHNNLPTFISCKMGSVDQMALYELETVATRFGGKYARKVLMVAKEVAGGHLERAKEMGIEVVWLK